MEVSASVYDAILKQRFPRQEVEVLDPVTRKMVLRPETDEEWRQRIYFWAETDRVEPAAPGKVIRSAGASPANE